MVPWALDVLYRWTVITLSRFEYIEYRLWCTVLEGRRSGPPR